MADFFGMYEFTQQFMSLWRSYKPTIARVHGRRCGGSDIALCCDLVIMAEEAVIGYPPARVWDADDRDVGVSARRRTRQAHAAHWRPGRRTRGRAARFGA